MPNYNSTSDDVKRNANGRWHDILQRLAGLDAQQLTNNHQPCPICGGDDRYRYDDADGNGRYFCNKCGAGDGFMLLQKINNWDFVRAKKEVALILGGSDVHAPPRKIMQKKKPKPTPISPAPQNAPVDDFYHYKLGKPSMTWAYLDENGNTTMTVARFELATGGKETVPRMWCSMPNGEQKWAWAAPRNRVKPIYGADILANSDPSTSVLIVEGEKTADAARRLIGQHVIVIAWLGGSKTRQLVDWTPLKDRSVAIWPDNDEDGIGTVTGKISDGGKWLPGLAELLDGIASKVQMIAPPHDVAAGWDLADAEKEGWTGDTVIEYIKSHVSPAISAKPTPPQMELPTTRATETTRPKTVEDPSDPDADVKPTKPLPIRALGYDKGNYYFLPSTTDQVTELTPAQMTKRPLNAMASPKFWERRFAGDRGADYDAAAAWMMDMCHQVGVYDHRRLRGRGCWWENKTPVLHLGDELLVDGIETQIADYSTRYIYEAAASLKGPGEEPLSDDAAREIINTAKLMRWESPGSAMLLCGWAVLAPICGALRWRPHVWITGGAGSGKTTIVSEFVRPLIGGMGHHVQGETTEAGVRQTLGSDALPILFDEAEQNEKRDNSRIQMVLSLMRQSSSESGAVVVKGSAGGQAREFDIRSAFCLVSISTGIKQLADETRISVLALKSEHLKTDEERAASQANWDKLRNGLAAITPDTGSKLLRRTVDLLSVIRANAETFATAAAEIFSSQRIGDQYGFLLAGAASLITREELSHDDAKQFIERCDLTSYVAASQEQDEERCLAKLLQHQLRVDGGHSACTLAIGELISIAHQSVSVTLDDSPVDYGTAVGVLGRLGLKVDGKELLISNSAAGVANILSDSPWAHSWSPVLRRLDGAKASGVIWFGSAVRGTRAVSIPMKMVNPHLNEGSVFV